MSGAAQRAANYRARLKAGKSVFMVEVDCVALVAALANAGFIAETAEASHEEVCQALGRAISLWIEETQ